MIGDKPVCLKCKNLLPDDPGLNCLAFPNGIPEAIIMGESDHKKPFPGDNGIQFELKEKSD